ncbi:MAG: SPOR domain-containing protein [Bacteroidetes bacterium]|nr:MAG: SPOR domain-containing protein [Bacteroidota bacterium]
MKILFIFLLFFNLSIYAQDIKQIGYSQTGKASYFPDNNRYALTRNGELFRSNAMEGAHQNIAYGSLIKVTNLANQRTAIIRINERPYTDKRILDVTRAAADVLGFTDQITVTDVKIEILAVDIPRNEIGKYDSYVFLGKNETKNPNIEPKTSVSSEKFKNIGTYNLLGESKKATGFALQVASFDELEKTLAEAKKTEKLQKEAVFIQVGWSDGKKMYRVLLGTFQSKEEAEQANDILSKKKITGFVKKHFD